MKSLSKLKSIASVTSLSDVTPSLLCVIIDYYAISPLQDSFMCGASPMNQRQVVDQKGFSRLSRQ